MSHHRAEAGTDTLIGAQQNGPESDPVSAGNVDAGVHRPVWHRGKMRSGAGAGADPLARRLPLPTLGPESVKERTYNLDQAPFEEHVVLFVGIPRALTFFVNLATGHLNRIQNRT